MNFRITLFNFFFTFVGKSFDDEGGDKFIFPHCSNFAATTVPNICFSLGQYFLFIYFNIIILINSFKLVIILL